MAFEKDKRKVVVLTSAGKDYSFYGKFEDFMEDLDENFMRCHNSIIVNVSRVEKMEKGNLFLEYGNGYIIIPISRTYLKVIREVFKNRLAGYENAEYYIKIAKWCMSVPRGIRAYNTD